LSQIQRRLIQYVTARELYNIIKAAEAGKSEDNPEAYRDYEIKPPVYIPTVEISKSSDKLEKLIFKTYRG